MNRFFRRVVDLKAEFDARPQLPFSEVITERRIDEWLKSLGEFYRDRVYPPCVTLWVFLSQVLSPDPSCRNAVARLLAFRTARGLPPCSTDTGSYCTARQRLPEELLAQLLRQTGRELAQEAPDAWRLHGRTIKLVDGSTVSMPDTPENAAAFGKPVNQRGCCGFPMARIVVLLCLATGAALELAIGPYRGKRSGELSLFRQLHAALEAGDIVLGDRLFCAYGDIARLAARGVDVVLRLHAQRPVDFRRGRRLGKDDHLVDWNKPTRRPDWLTPAEFAALPDRMRLREVRVRVATAGFRVRALVVVTTLTDPEQFSPEDIAGLYRQRWQAELDLRSIKSVMQMDVLRCQTPEMVRKELWTHLLAYNLLRSVMCAAADEAGLSVRDLSFKGTLQLLNGLSPYLLLSAGEALARSCEILLSAVRQHPVGNRPDRCEPRKRKRAAKPYPTLKLPRSQERKQCL
jgi:Transposase DDE domain